MQAEEICYVFYLQVKLFLVFTSLKYKPMFRFYSMCPLVGLK